MGSNKLKRRIEAILKLANISTNAIELLMNAYPSFSETDVRLDTLSQLERKNLVERMLDTLKGDINTASQNHISSLRSIVDNVSTAPVNLIHDIKVNTDEIRKFTNQSSDMGDTGSIEDFMPSSLKKYNNHIIKQLVWEVYTVSRVLKKITALAHPIIKGSTLDSTVKLFRAGAMKLDVKNHDLAKGVVDNTDIVLFVGKYILLTLTKSNELLIQTLLTPTPRLKPYPDLLTKDVNNIINTSKHTVSSLENILDDRNLIKKEVSEVIAKHQQCSIGAVSGFIIPLESYQMGSGNKTWEEISE